MTDCQDLAIVTSVSEVLLDKVKKNAKGLFAFDSPSPPRFNDIRLFSVEEAFDLLPPSKVAITKKAWSRYAAVAGNHLVLPKGN